MFMSIEIKDVVILSKGIKTKGTNIYQVIIMHKELFQAH